VTLRTPAVTTRGPKNEPYPDFMKRVAEDSRRVKAKCAALGMFTPRCTYCGETCDPIEAGSRCKENGMGMVSYWAEEKSKREWFRLGNFGGSWHIHAMSLGALLDRVRAGEE
jgi:hypothetical protein